MKNLTASRWSHCDRKLWLDYRNAFKSEMPEKRQIATRLGRAAEDIVINILRERGLIIRYTQLDLFGKWGQLIARIDGIASLSDDKAHKILEIKAVNNKAFKAIMKNGLPDYYTCQIQIEMHHSDQIAGGDRITETMYCLLNRDTCELVDFDIQYDPFCAELQSDRLHDIMEREDMPPRDESFKCNMCDHRTFCEHGLLPEIGCRTCANVSAEAGEFHCQFGDEPCGNHLIHPAFMLALGCEIQYADAENMAIDYGTVVHGPEGYKHPTKDTFTSREYVKHFEEMERQDNEL